MSTKSIHFLLAFFITLSFQLFAQGSEEGKDHPMLSRMPNFNIDSHESNFNAAQIPVGEEQEKTVEGHRTAITYVFNGESGSNPPSELQVIRNYDNAIKKLGGKTLYNNNSFLSGYKVEKQGKNIWVRLDVMNNGEMYTLTVVEEEAMKQEVTANELFEALNKEGFVAVYINFDTGKAEIKEESNEIIQQIVQMLKANPTLKVSIEGHTDNVGTSEANKALSLNRAKSVVKALTAKGIDAKRLQSLGWGPEKPIADNRTEEGKAKNRRVEIVKL